MTPGRDEQRAGPRMLTALGCGMGIFIVVTVVVVSTIADWMAGR